MSRKPNVICPACKELHQRIADSEYVVICAIVLEEYEKGESNYENYTVVPSNCEDDHYLVCPVWRKAKDVNWQQNMQKYSSLEQAEKIRL